MPIDLNTLPLTSEEAEVSWDNYQDPPEFGGGDLIPEGIHTFVTTKVEVAKFESVAKGDTIKPMKDGTAIKEVVSFVLDHEAFDDQGVSIGTLGFDRISTRPFLRGGARASMAADQLRAYGDLNRPANPREWADAMMSHTGTTNGVWKGSVKWEGFCGHKETEFQTGDGTNPPGPNAKPATDLKGKRSFDAEGKAKCSVCQKDIQARSKVDRRVPRG